VGNVLINTGDFIFDNSEKNQVDLSSDVVFLNEKKKSLSNFFINWDLSIKIQGLVKTRYHALVSKIEGNLRLIKTEKSPSLGIGKLNLVQGEYSYLGQVLKIGKGSSLLFTGGPLINPNLNISAERDVVILPQPTSTYGTIENQNSGLLKTLPSQLGSPAFISLPNQLLEGSRKAKIGVRVTGFAANPVISLYADPADAITSKTELLSYLITGEPSSNLSGAGIQLLVSAVSPMNNGNSVNSISNALHQLEEKTGLNNISIGSMPIMDPQTGLFLPNASLVLNKDLTPKLSLTYSVGLLKPINIFQVNLSLDKYLTLQSRNTNYSQGINLLFTKEKE
jgi:autotransporter translocation and assembly factor TamB